MNRILQEYFKIVKKLIPQKSDVPAVGLDIGTGSCKMLQLKQAEEGGYKLMQWAVEPVENANVLACAQQALAHLKESCTSVYTAVSGKGTLIRYITMPLMSLEDLKSSWTRPANSVNVPIKGVFNGFKVCKLQCFSFCML